MAVNSLGEFALIIGDIHIPQRATDIPDKFRDLLLPNKMQYVLSPGNVGSREVGNPHRMMTKFCFSDRGVARESSSGKELGTYCQRGI